MRLFKKIAILIINTVFVAESILNLSAISYNQSPNLKKSYVLMEAETGTVLQEENAYAELPVGTMNKLMTLLLVAEEIDNGNINLDTVVNVSSNASGLSGATIWLLPGDKISVEDLLKGLIIGNANDAAVVLAECVAQTESKFVELMNTRAFELGMKNTGFCDCTGYDNDKQYSSAYDLALLCREIIKYEYLYKYMTCWIDYIRDGATELVNENTLVRNYDGLLGIKAGHSEKSGNTVALAASKNGSTYIAVVLGCEDKSERFSLGKSLLKSGFSNYTVTNPMFSNELIMPVKVKGGVENAVEIEVKELTSLVVSKGDDVNISSEIFLPEYITAPVNKSQPIGKVAFYVGDTMLYETDLVTANAVEKLTIGKAFKNICIKLLE